MLALGTVVLGLVTAERLGELMLARRNTARLLAAGGHEVSASHYPLIVAMHALWLASLWIMAPGRPVNIPLLAVFALLQAGRAWVLGTLGRRWTTRIIVVPGEQLVRAGPFRWISHPNYVVVAGEIACLPMVFGLPVPALVFTLLNAAVLWIRIRAEERAIRPS